MPAGSFRPESSGDFHAESCPGGDNRLHDEAVQAGTAHAEPTQAGRLHIESELYRPVKKYLESQGYAVNAEVRHCDVTAERDGELIVVELKTRFNATLLIQAADRQRVADVVYVALPAPGSGRRSRHWNGMCHLLKRLEIGLILVRFLKSGPRVEIAFHPAPYKPARQKNRRTAIIREIHDRSGDYNTGGSTGAKLVTAYREEAIRIACCLADRGPLSPAQLKCMGCGQRTGSILSKNYYGWFERVDRGVYRLHASGKKALNEYPEIAAHFRNGQESENDRD